MKVRCDTPIELVAIADLKPHPKNPNDHTPEQILELAEILKYQGWRSPVKVSNQSGFVTAGHGRIEAAKANGWTHVPVSRQDYDSEDQEYADVVADNAIAAWAEIDLAKVNQNVVELDPSFNLRHLGIENFKLDVSEKDEGTGGGADEEDLAPQFIIAVQCKDEPDMQKLFEELTARGFQCKLIT